MEWLATTAEALEVYGPWAIVALLGAVVVYQYREIRKISDQRLQDQKEAGQRAVEEARTESRELGELVLQTRLTLEAFKGAIENQPCRHLQQLTR